jgi:hypothetical protein
LIISFLESGTSAVQVDKLASWQVTGHASQVACNSHKRNLIRPVSTRIGHPKKMNAARHSPN